MLFGDRLAAEVPDAGANLGVGVEGEALVDAPELAVVPHDYVPGLAVSVVGDQVIAGNHAEDVVVAFIEGVVVLPGVVLDEVLDRSDAVGAIADDGEGDEVPFEDFAEEVGGVFPLVEGTRGEVPEGHLAVAGLVDGEPFPLAKTDPGQEGVVGAVRSEFAGEELALGKEIVSGLVVAHRWTLGMGRSTGA